MSGTLRDLLVPPQGEKEKHFTPQHIISLASFPALAALSGHVVQQVLDWNPSNLSAHLSVGLQQLVCVARAMCACSTAESPLNP